MYSLENIKNKECIYFLKLNGVTSPIKIGSTKKGNVTSVLKQLKRIAPYGIKLIGFIKTNNSTELEKLFHRYYSKYKIKKGWFEINDNEVDILLKKYNTNSFNNFVKEYTINFNSLSPFDKYREEITDHIYKRIEINSLINYKYIYENKFKIHNTTQREFNMYLKKIIYDLYFNCISISINGVRYYKIILN